MKVVKLSIVCVSLMLVSLMFTSIGNAKIDIETCVGMWLFDEGKGDVAKDSSGNGNDGVLKNDPEWGKGKIGSALKFDGKDDYVEVPDSSSLDVSTEVSISLWAYINHLGTSSGDDVIIDKMVSDPKGPFEILFFSASELEGRFTLASGTTIRLGAGLTPPDKSWHHYASTFQSGEQKLYFDGKAVASNSATGTLIQNDLPIHIGKGVERNYNFDGIIDEAGIFSVALSEAEIREIMSKGFQNILNVSPRGKLATAWGALKSDDESFTKKAPTASL